jgi:hypothetical protein
MSRSSVLTTPRPVPSRLVPALAGATVILLALPIFLLADWRLAGWALAAVLWVGNQTFGLLLGRLRDGLPGVAASGVLGFGLMIRAVAVLVVLVAVAASDQRLALATALVYALAYTAELGLSLLAYFGGAK